MVEGLNKLKTHSENMQNVFLVADYNNI
ncbi:hypothetical protein PEPE_0553 [Pediococcus pentosaceus ATCC 25745]|uniref:Uncharacterized protein n=1 Tax=Pediococcus pentosaceus (strain ATCC 25745 / CCUG 21536 / LMG 10740 / 183-1w) TaxID=278197 RepID=Q03GN1_PEDPA|nr:hypothetical protein PEPE_0553 [Pediococcus pentosaceus ATCC 25745]